MPEKSYKKTFNIISVNNSGVCRSDPFGNRSADASIFFCWIKYQLHFMRHFYSHFRSMCDRSCGKGYWKLLVPGRADNYSCTYTNWWAWSDNSGSICFPSLSGKKYPLCKEAPCRMHFSA